MCWSTQMRQFVDAVAAAQEVQQIIYKSEGWLLVAAPLCMAKYPWARY